MALKDFFKSVFSRSGEAASLDEAIWKSSLQIADDYVRHCNDVTPDCRFSIAMALACGLVHMADRIAFEAIPERRSEVMDKLGVRIAILAAEEAISSGFPSERKKEIAEKALSEMDAAAQVYGQCKKVSPERDEPIKGTLLWEFGKRFAEAANQPMDIAAIMFGSGMLVNAATKIKIRERLLSY